MTPREAAEIVTILTHAPTNQGAAWAVETQDVFARLIDDLPYAPAMAAARTWLQTQPQRPSITEFRGAVRTQLEQAGTVPADLDPDQAWGEVVRAFSIVGRYREFPSTHPALKRVVERLGWETLCNSDNPEADRAHFLRLYAAELDRVRRDRHSAAGLALPGDSDRLRIASTPEQQPARYGPNAELQKLRRREAEIRAELEASRSCQPGGSGRLTGRVIPGVDKWASARALNVARGLDDGDEES